MNADPKKNDELKDKDLESVAGGASGTRDPVDTGDEVAIPPTGDYGAPVPAPTVDAEIK